MHCQYSQQLCRIYWSRKISLSMHLTILKNFKWQFCGTSGVVLWHYSMLLLSWKQWISWKILFEIFLFFRPKARTSASIILRGANDFMLDEMERSLHDALCVVKRVLESKTVVPGGGAVEAALSIYLENFASSLVSYILLYFLSQVSKYWQDCLISLTL